MFKLKSVLRFYKILLLTLILLAVFDISADERAKEFSLSPDPRGLPDITICTQNLGLFGTFSDSEIRQPSLTKEEYKIKLNSLVERFMRARCDIIAVQEVLGEKTEAFKALLTLRERLRKKWNRFFNIVNGDGEYASRCAFLFAIDKVELLHSVTYQGVELPKINPQDASRSFPRAPLEVQLRTLSGIGAEKKILRLITFHFKSKRGGWKDPAQLEYETHRMVMAEALRRIILSRHNGAVRKGTSPLILLGDRNSDEFSASARILEGSIHLGNFFNGKTCRIGGGGAPLCTPMARGPQDFFSVLTSDVETRSQGGTFLYKKKPVWLDDILLPAEALHYARTRLDDSGNYDSGLLFEPKEASDHALAYVKLNW